MGFECITVAMISRQPELSVVRALRALLEEWLPAFVVARQIDGTLVAGETLAISEHRAADLNGTPLWAGEEIAPGRRLTRLVAEGRTPAASVLRLAAAAPDELGKVRLTIRGALRHRPPFEDEHEGWYGRWVTSRDRGRARLVEPFRLGLRLDEGSHEISVAFPIMGYPLSPFVPPVDEDERAQVTDQRAIVAENVERLVGAIARAQDALQLPAGAAEWSIVSDRATLEGAALLDTWMPKLAGGELLKKGAT